MGIIKNQEIVIEITGTTHDGSGVGRFENMAVFIPECAEGDTIRARILSVKKNYAYGKLLEILTPSPARVAADCPAFSRCGGCVFRHIGYQEELGVKWKRVADAISKIARLPILPEEIEGSPLVEGYRNKAQYPVGLEGNLLNIGFYAPRSHRIIPAQGCRLQPSLFEKALETFRLWINENSISIYDEKTQEGLLRHIYLRYAEATGQLMACAVINGSRLPAAEKLVSGLRASVPEISSILYNCNRQNTNVILGSRTVTVWGKERITDILCGKSFEISPRSFYQVNRRQAEKLYRTAGDFAALDGKGLLLDLYCGAGTIGICLSNKVERLIGVEVVPEAVEDAKRNAALNGIKNAEFICSDASGAAMLLARKGLRPDAVVVDPPRKGLEKPVIDAVVQMSPRRIVYVSCDPSTLARDLSLFAGQGYLCSRLKPFDMFPRTSHVETVCLLKKTR